MAGAAVAGEVRRGAPPAAGWAAGPLGRAQAADRELSRQTALRVRALAEFAATRPASVDRPQGQRGAMSAERWAARPEVLRDVSEWAAQEVVIALSITQQAAEAQLERSLTLVHRLPATLDALEAGALHPGHLWPLLEHVAPIADARLRAEIEADLLAWMAGRVTTPAQLGDKTRRLVLARDARTAGRRLAAAIKERGVHLGPERTPGMASVTAVLTMPEAQALYRALGAYADQLRDDPAEDGAAPRTRGQKMVDCLLDLVFRPGETDLPPVQVLLTVVASLGTLLGGDQPGEVDGQVVPAEMVRHLLRSLTGRNTGPADAASDAGSDGAADRADRSGDGSWVLPDDDELARWWDEVERRVLAGELPDEPDPVPDEVLRRWAEELPVDLRGGPPDAAAAAAGSGGPATEAGPPPAEPDTVTGSTSPWGCTSPSGAASACDPASCNGAERAAAGSAAAGSGWWARADEAVRAAGEGLRRATEALGHARRMVRTARAADAADEAAWRAGPAGRVAAATDALDALDAATDAQRRELAALLDTTAGGGLADRPRIALVDALSGTLRALSDLPALRRAATCGAPACRRRPEDCAHDLAGRPGLGPPGPTDGYRPGRELDRWVRARDRRCRFPGCRRRVPQGGELDHDRRYPEGPTSAGNLAGYCTPNHRGKHQAPGFEHQLAPDGTLTVRTPTGMSTSTTPEPYCDVIQGRVPFDPGAADR